MRFQLHQFDEVFRVRTQEGQPYVLIGGQAVNYWAELYLDYEPDLAQWLPFTSEDIDFRGNRDDVVRIAHQLGLVAQFPDWREITALAGIIPLRIGDLRTNIEVVRTVPGIPASKIEAWAVKAVRGELEIRVLDPISLLCCKTRLALKINQKLRRDVDHLRILILCVRAFLRETLNGVEAGLLPIKGWLSAVERTLRLTELTVGKQAARQFALDWNEVLPHAEINASLEPKVIGLRENRLSRWHRSLG